ncbi:hypothetical protein HN51_056310 [Arachis hypogaea]|uniref:uncharacterized protein n=1 Tax=Arachis hypogaea TaxID=3818 RepID=UPI0034E69674
MNSSTKSSILFSLGLILIIANVAQGHVKVTASLVPKLCESGLVEERAKCMDILRSNPKIQSAKTFRELSELILELAVNKATEGQKFLQTLAEKDKSPAIQECAGFDYNNAVVQFKGALRDLKEDTSAANYASKLVGDDVSRCHTILARAKIVNPAIDQLNSDISLLSNVAFAATSLIEKKYQIDLLLED